MITTINPTHAPATHAHVASVRHWEDVRGEKTSYVLEALPFADGETSDNAYVLLDSKGANICASSQSGQVSIPLPREWDEASKKRLRTLITKSAVGPISNAEQAEKAALQNLRRQETPGRTYEEIVYEADRARKLEVLLTALADYVQKA
jgi:hypothetical protein